MTKLFYLAVVMRLDNNVGSGVQAIPLRDMYTVQNRLTSNEVDIVNNESSSTDPMYITHFAYGRTRESALKKLNELDWKNYRNDVNIFNWRTQDKKTTALRSGVHLRVRNV